MIQKMRKTAVWAAAVMLCASAAAPLSASAAYGVGGNGTAVMEYLDRGIYAVKSGNGMFVSWRWNADDADDAEFRLYRDNQLIYTSKSGDATCYQDNGGNTNSKYRVDTVVNGTVTGSQECRFNSGANYFDIALNSPGAQYSPNDCVVGDSDGDGQYEIFLKWDPNNSQDNSKSGKTDNVIIDCYTLTGKQLWRIDLGRNIRAGQHYTQMCVADFDLDGKAELITKTADGTKDGKGKVIGDGSKDYRNGDGYVLSGPEYMTLFDGLTGAALDTISFPVPRGDVSKWGDKYGNRVDRFNSGIAYLDGVHPSAIYNRGYYTRMTISAVDVENKKLKVRWIFDSNNSGSGAAYGQGNHNLMTADVDNDGRQEISMGDCVIDDNGKLLWASGKGHGDAQHLGDFVPDRPGLELWQCHEGSPWGVTLFDAKNGQVIFHKDGDKDTGRCCADNVWAGSKGSEFWGARPANTVMNSKGEKISGKSLSMNFLIYWDGDLEREMLSGTGITKMKDANTIQQIFTANGCESNNSTKAVPCLTADLFGDWREELIMRTSDNRKLRIWCTTAATSVRLTNLMHDMQYRAQNCCQQSSYNQPPHTSYYLGSDAPLPARPKIRLNNSAAAYTPPEPVILSGKYVKNLQIKDTANASGWKLADQGAAVGSTVFGDRAYTYITVPEELRGAEVIESACNSKNTDAELAAFTAGGKIDTFVLLDTRVEANGSVPAWLSGWEKTAMTATTDNDVTFSVYQKTFGDGETVTLGTNGMSGTVVNYTVFVREAAAVTTTVTTVTTTETTVTTTTETAEAPAELLRGDVNCNRIVDVSDSVLLARLIAEDATAKVTAQGLLNADCNNDGNRTRDDLIILLQYIAKLIPNI